MRRRLAVDAIRDAVERSLSRAPFVYRKAGDSPFLRQSLIPFRGAGYVGAVRDQGCRSR